MKVEEGKAISVLQDIFEGCGLHKTGGLVSVNGNTVTRFSWPAGGHAEALHDEPVAFPPKDGMVQKRGALF